MAISSETQKTIDHYKAVRDLLGEVDVAHIKTFTDWFVSTFSLTSAPELAQDAIELFCNIFDPEAIAEQDPGFTEGPTDEDLAAFICVDCSVNTSEIDEYYMVQDRVWVGQAHMKKDGGMLCLGCLETRIGRLLTPADFTHCPVNEGIFGRSERFLNRLGFKEAA